jgi:hypothetical protein
MKWLRFVLLLLVLIAPFCASAQVPKTTSFEDATATLSASCGKDIDINCRGVNLESNRLKECLSRNRETLSPKCQSDYVGVFDAIQKRISARFAVSRTCDRDAAKLCPGATKEDGKALQCLLALPKGIGWACNQAISTAGYR